MSDDPSRRLLDALKAKARQNRTNYLTEGHDRDQPAMLKAVNCPQCGAARVGQELRFCGHCGHAFLQADTTAGGVYLTPPG